MPVGTEVKDVNTEVNANSATEDIVNAAEKAQDTEAKGAGASTADEQAVEGSEQPEGVKTQPETTDEDELDKGIKEGSPISYDRFKKVNEERKALKSRIKEFEDSQVDDGIDDAILKDPEVAALILKKQGYTDAAIAEKFKEVGIEAKPKDEGKEPTFDLTTVEGWDKKIEHTLNKLLEKRLGPVEKSLNETQTKEQMRTFSQRMDKEKGEAEALAKEFGIEYGDEKDAKDPTTGAGKIMTYLQKHPEKVKAAAHGILSKSDLLRLAIGEEGVKLGEKKGEKAEKDRVMKVRQAAMEGGGEITTDKVPTASSSSEDIIAYKHKHPDWTP